MSSRKAAEVFPPGEFIREELAARGWTQTDLARILGRPLSALNQIMKGKKAVTPATAQELAAAFGTSPEFWVNLEAVYRLSLSELPNDAIRRRARLYKIAPVKEMERRHWIKRTVSAEELEGELKRFFGVESLYGPPKMLLAARTRIRSNEEITTAQTAWCYRAAKVASMLHVSRFTKAAFNAGCTQLRALMKSPEEIRNVPRVLASMGVRFVVVEHLPSTKIDGAVFWIGPNCAKPVIALSMRYDRIDWFWYTLSHELSHVRHHDGYMLDTNLVNVRGNRHGDRSDVERRADKESAEFLIPAAKLNSFITRVGPLYSRERIIQFAKPTGVHPGIVVGQLQHRGEIGYAANRKMLVKVREILLQAAMTDGWGKMISLE